MISCDRKNHIQVSVQNIIEYHIGGSKIEMIPKLAGHNSFRSYDIIVKCIASFFM